MSLESVPATAGSIHMSSSSPGNGAIEGLGARGGLVGLLSAWLVDAIAVAAESTLPRADVLQTLAVIGLVVVVVALLRSIATRSAGTPRARMLWLLVSVAGVFTMRSAVDGVELDRIGRASRDLDGSILRLEGVVRSHEAAVADARRGERGSGTTGILLVTGPVASGLVGSEIRYRAVDDETGISVGSGVVMRGLWKANRSGESVSIGRFLGTLSIGHSDLIRIESRTDSFARWRSTFRTAWLDAVDSVCSIERAATGAGGVLDAVLTGRRDTLDPEIRIDARRSGLAHLLAISGFHLALVGSAVLLLTGRLAVVGRFAALVVVMLFALVVVPSPSVVRSASMALVVGSCLLLGRRPRGRSVLMVVLAGMAWCEPTVVRSAGFQLSAVATTGLVWSAREARNRWFGPRDRLGITRTAFLRHRFSLLATAAITAWIATMPIVVGRFGQPSLLSVPASILGTPLLAASMIAGLLASSLKLASSLGVDATADLADLAGRVAIRSASGLVDLIRGCGRLVDPISLPTTRWGEIAGLPLGLGLAIGLGRVASRRIAVVMVVGAVLGCSVLLGSAGGGRWLRVLALGDGTCIVIRDGSTTTLYDVGSSSIGSVGSRVIVPELRRAGIRALDSVVISHANRDHYNGLSEVLGAFPVTRVLMSDATIRSWRRGRLPALDRSLDRARSQGVEIGSLGRGDQFLTDTLLWRVLHPLADEPCRTVNDESIVLAVFDRAVRTGRAEVLFCGDIQIEGMARLLRREPTLRARVMEMPHHGSWNRLVGRLIDHVDPRIIVQSTGPNRWRNDRLSTAVRSRDRRVTCRDGSIHIDLDRSTSPFRSSEDRLRGPDRRGRSDSTPP
ncbi:MAG: ComEC/Rec2 family competence protein [Planctomycetota bacterium]|nr:ComEC/Rec2 family competence protein [Planctomycetota bacterium]